MKKIYPRRLVQGDLVRIVAPARSLVLISDEIKQIATTNLEKLGLRVDFGKNVNKSDFNLSSSIEDRIEDLHEAFADTKVKGVLTVIGGFNSNQLLKHIDWKLIKNNPKIVCGYSDITALLNAIYAKTGLVTYYGPFFSSFGQKQHFEYTTAYFQKCLFSSESFSINKSDTWSNDAWYKDQDNRTLINNEGFYTINNGKAKGTIIGGNLNTLQLLLGTEYLPSLKDSILFIEDDCETRDVLFERDLQSFIYQKDFKDVKGVVIGRFEKKSDMTKEKLIQLIKSKKELTKIPVIADVDFGHTDPRVTFPIGGEAEIVANTKETKINILRH